MKARLIKSTDGETQLLYADGTIKTADTTDLAILLSNFKGINGIKGYSGTDGRWDTEIPDMGLYPGETLALVTDSEQLVIYTFEPFANVLDEHYRSKKRYLSVTEYAKKHNKSREIIKVFCREGRLVGATKTANAWVIPEDAPYPVPAARQREGYHGPRQRRVTRTNSNTPSKASEGGV